MSKIRLIAVILTMFLFLGIGLYLTTLISAIKGDPKAEALIEGVSAVQSIVKQDIGNAFKKSKTQSSTSSSVKVEPSKTGTVNQSQSTSPQSSTIPSTTIKSINEKSIEEIAKIKSNVVVVTCGSNLGSGVAYSKDGYVLTNYHVIKPNLPCFVSFEDQSKPNGIGDKIPAKIIKFDKNKDLALLKIEKSLENEVPFGDSNSLKAGEKIVTIGNPDGLINTVADGIVSNTRKMQYVTMIQITSPITHGSSGGALLNMHGELVGITSSGVEGGGNLNFAISSNDVKTFLNSN